MIEVLPNTAAGLAIAADALRRGDLVGLPTETVYGVAASALDVQAVGRIYAIKDRPSFNPLILHVGAGSDPLDRLIAQGIVDGQALHEAARGIVRRLLAAWPAPLTVVLPRGAAVPDLTTAGLDTVAVRCPDHPVAQALLAAVGVPLAAPSANRSGRISPTTANDVVDELGDRLAWVVDGGPCRVGLESTVVHLAPDGALTLLRHGALDERALVELAGAPMAVVAHGDDRPRSPGMTSRHYAPATPFYALPTCLGDAPAPVRERIDALTRTASVVGVLCWTAADAHAATRSLPHHEVHAMALTAEGDAHEAARRLFGTLRALDALHADVLFAEPCPPAPNASGLAFALRDRLARATSPLG